MSQISKNCGFKHGTPETEQGKLIIITRVQDKMVMDIAGLHEDDQVLLDSVDDLYELLAKNQGNVVEIPVRRCNAKNLINVQVPEMEIIPIKIWPFNKY